MQPFTRFMLRLALAIIALIAFLVAGIVQALCGHGADFPALMLTGAVVAWAIGPPGEEMRILWGALTTDKD
jgi:hypothetical protein